MSSASTPTDSRVQSIGECPVCMEIMRDPKTLKCQHSYCKECLEGIVQIDKSRAVVRCPMCQNEHLLGDGQTVSDLEAQLTLKQVLDVIEEYHCRSRKYTECCSAAEKNLSPRCLRTDESDEHDAKMEWYCWNCKSFFCKKCLNLHSLLSICGSKFYEVKFCEAYDSFTLFCGKHNAFHSHGCLWCCETFCSYCLPENHSKEKLLDVSNKCKIVSFREYASKFKNPLLEKIATMKDYTTKQKSVINEIDKSSLQSQSKIEDFKKYIEERKIIVLSQVLFFLELTGKQVMHSFKSEFTEYETSKLKMKEVINSKLNSVQDVLQKSETLAGTSMIEIITRTKDLQDEFHSLLPGDIEEHEINLPAFYNVSDHLIDNIDIRHLLAGVQASFGDTHISTMEDNGSYEPIEKLLNLSTNVDYSPIVIAQLDNVSESRKYITKCLKKMGLHSIVGNTPDKKETDAGEVEDENGKGKNKKKNKNKNKDTNSTTATTTDVLDEKETDAVEVVEEEKGKGKNQKKNKNKDTNSTTTATTTTTTTTVPDVPETQGPATVEPEDSKDNLAKYCELCGVTCSNGSYEGHIAGSKHKKNMKKKHLEELSATAVEPKTDEANESDESDVSSIAEEEGETQSNKQAGGGGRGRGRDPRRKRRGGNKGAAAHGATSSQEQHQFGGPTSNGSYSAHNYILEVPPGMRNNESNSGRGGNFQHRGAPPFRGEHRGGNMNRGGDMSRGGNMHGRGEMHRGRNMHHGQSHGRGNRGGPNRGQQNNNRGRGAPHQHPTAASSLDLVQCYKCGHFGHRVSDCPQS